MSVNFNLSISESAVVYLETSATAGLRIVAQGRSGWGTILTIESAKPDVMGELSWTLEQRFAFNSAGERAYPTKSGGDTTAEALLLVLIKQRQLTRELDRSKEEATAEWHKNNPERMGR